MLIDVTHKTSNTEMPLYTMMVIDGNGESLIGATFLLKHEDEASIRQMMKIFNDRNPCWKK